MSSTQRLQFEEVLDLIEYQINSIRHTSTSICIGGHRMLDLDNGTGIWVTLDNNASELERLVEKGRQLIAE